MMDRYGGRHKTEVDARRVPGSLVGTTGRLGKPTDKSVAKTDVEVT